MIQKATLFFALLITTSCSSKEPPAFKADGTPSFRSEVFERTRASRLFEAIQKYLKDNGYELKDVNPSLGYLSGIRIFDMDSYSVEEPFGPVPTKASSSDRVLIEANVHVVELKSAAKVRINLTQKLINVSGEVLFASPVSTSDSYDRFIEQIKIMVRQEPTSPSPAKKQR